MTEVWLDVAEVAPSSARRVAAAARDRLEAIGRVALVGAVAGAAGLGLGSRLAMRVVALANAERLELTLDGTAFLLVAGTVGGAVIAVLTVGVLGRWLPTGRRRWLATVALAAALPAIAFLDPSNIDFVLFGPRWLTVGLFTLVPLVYAAIVALLLPRAPRWGARRLTRGALVTAGVAATGGSVALAGGAVTGSVALAPLPLAVLAAIAAGPGSDGGRIAPVGRALVAVLAVAAAATFVWRAVVVALV